MRKLLNKPWVVALLAIAAVGFVAHSLMSPMSGYGSGLSSSVAEETAPETGQAAAAEDSSPRSIADALRDLSINPAPRDPFTPRAKPEAAPQVAAEKTPEPDSVESVKLTALWIQSGSTYLLVNDRVMTTGETIGRLTLEAAATDGVWLTHWRGRDFLSIGSTFTLTTPAKQAASKPAQPAPGSDF